MVGLPSKEYFSKVIELANIYEAIKSFSYSWSCDLHVFKYSCIVDYYSFSNKLHCRMIFK